MDTKERIISVSEGLFFKYGVRSVTLDQIASEIGISKKTIYQHFKDKDELVLEVTVYSLEKDRGEMDRINQLKLDPIAEILAHTTVMRAIMSQINPTLLLDIFKYHPLAWEKYQEGKKFFLEDIRNNLTNGVREGYYRSDFNVDVLSKMRIEIIEMAFNQDLFPVHSFSLINVQMEFLDHFMKGILTEKGLQKYSELKSNETKRLEFEKVNK